jgi:glucose/arabinose dehydrogenase
MFDEEPTMRRRVAIAISVLTLALGAGAVMVATAPASLAAVGDFNFNQPQVVASGLQIPWGMTFLPDGSALIAERATAQIKQLRPGSTPVVVATVPGVVPDGEGGLLGLAVSPTYSQDQFVYAYFGTASDNRIVRFRLNSPQTQEVILSGLAKASIHDGGRIAFGPDGMLYAGVGDASNTANAQNLQSMNGKILRMTPTGGVPASGNPFANSRVYSLGHRNVQGLAWDAQGRLWATEFGQNTWDEINLIVAGGNYGWPTVEGMSTNTQFRNPLVVWTTAESSPSGAAIVGNRLFAAALRGTRLWQITLNGQGGVSGTASLLQGQFGRLRTVMLGPDGWLWVATSNRDGRGAPVATDDRVLRFPPSDAPPVTPPPSTPPNTTPPTTTPPSTTPPTVGPTNPAGSCAVHWEVTNQWSDGFVATVTLTNRGAALSSWTLTWTFAGNQLITNSWNTVLTQTGPNVTARNAAWNGTLATNASVSFGFQATYSGTNTAPSPIRLGGTACASV